MSKKLIVAIDGPAGSGKSTSAKLVAQKLNFLYIDTGAMYRAITYLAIKNNVLNNNDELFKLAKETDIKLDFREGFTKVFANGTEITDKIRQHNVNVNVSDVSKVEDVRKELVKKQQQMGRVSSNGIVMEGRDIGTVVFPGADVKIFLNATLDQRVKRRTKEYETNGDNVTVEEIKENLEKRDRLDSTREISPLVKAPDAVEIDTSAVTIDQQVNIILEQISNIAESKGIELSIK